LIWCVIHFVVARQLGFENVKEVPYLCILVQEYLKKFKGCDGRIYEYVSHADEENINFLYIKFVVEFERPPIFISFVYVSIQQPKPNIQN